MARKRDWFVSTLTALTCCGTRAEAEALQDANAAAGRDPGRLIRECECGCEQPSGVAVDDKRSRAMNARRARASNRAEV